ncbi:hypothetical protein F5B21DRAFT_502203 [Xylaria acuta]|nr:hypothetical protein F5B21DRAFT_502203 [Xylaria acuta]
MSEYTSTLEGFQRSMEWGLTGPPEESYLYAESTTMPTFYQIINGQRLAYDAFVKHVMEWRVRVSEFRPVVDEFLRDGDRLAAHTTGTMTVDGVGNSFESFIFAKVDKESGKMEWMIERSVWGRTGEEPEHGVN